MKVEIKLLNEEKRKEEKTNSMKNYKKKQIKGKKI